MPIEIIGKTLLWSYKLNIGKLTLALFILFLSLIQGSLAQTTPHSESQILIGTRWIIVSVRTLPIPQFF